MLYPKVKRLDVQLENQNNVVLQRGKDKRVLDEENLGKTTLIAFFDFDLLNPLTNDAARRRCSH
jgi:hypothetical protein